MVCKPSERNKALAYLRELVTGNPVRTPFAHLGLGSQCSLYVNSTSLLANNLGYSNTVFTAPYMPAVYLSHSSDTGFQLVSKVSNRIRTLQSGLQISGFEQRCLLTIVGTWLENFPKLI